MKLILVAGSVISFAEDLGIGDIIATYETMAAAQADEAKITPANVSHIRTTTDEDASIGEYFNLIIDSTEIVPVYEDEETISEYELHIHLREKTDIEILTERMDALEESQDIQDGAIDDLGEAVSILFEEE